MRAAIALLAVAVALVASAKGAAACPPRYDCSTPTSSPGTADDEERDARECDRLADDLGEGMLRAFSGVEVSWGSLYHRVQRLARLWDSWREARNAADLHRGRARAIRLSMSAGKAP